MNIRMINLFARLLLNKGEKVYFTRRYMSYTDIDEEYIVINPEESAGNPDFLEHIKNEHGYEKVYDFPHVIWTVLHEIGHLRTDIFVEETEEEVVLRKFCTFASESGELAPEQINKIYYDMSDEWAATEWAIDFVKNHYLFCKFFGRMVKKA